MGAGVYWLSTDSADIKFDPRVHTYKKLEDIIETIYLEYACSYVYCYYMIINLKKEGKFNSNILQNVRQTYEGFTKRSDEMITQKYKISNTLLEKWIRNFAKEK